MRVSYVLPLRAPRPLLDGDLTVYLAGLARSVDVLVVGGSAPDVFAAHAVAWGALVHHLPVDPDLATPMGKVGGVLTGLRHARHERVVIADDDVRYDAAGLEPVARRLDAAFPPAAALWAPLWLAERAVGSWLAVGSRVLRGGVRYGGTTLSPAATPTRVLRRRHAGSITSTSMGLNEPLFDSSAEQAVTPTT